ncbi:hypothetical protein ACSCBZ_42620 [Streptomyces niveiscabiei]|uniref:hypothetical protein n=1 Tax=Streptomyces niveiscabiei TaxID=164115 RepID=UPI0006EB55DB|nr:hypothetical protein [Streptomyces niveiscabiei]
MESPTLTAWFAFSDNLPAGEVVVPVMTEHGLGIAIRRGAMPQDTLDELNRTAQFVLGVGLAQINPSPKPPDPEK